MSAPFNWRQACPEGYEPAASSNGAECELVDTAMPEYYTIRTVVLLCVVFVPGILRRLEKRNRDKSRGLMGALKKGVHGLEEGMKGAASGEPTQGRW